MEAAVGGAAHAIADGSLQPELVKLVLGYLGLSEPKRKSAPPGHMAGELRQRSLDASSLGPLLCSAQIWWSSVQVSVLGLLECLRRPAQYG